MTLQRIAMDARPGGPTAKRKPSPEGLGSPEDDQSAGGAALNCGLVIRGQRNRAQSQQEEEKHQGD